MLSFLPVLNYFHFYGSNNSFLSAEFYELTWTASKGFVVNTIQQAVTFLLSVKRSRILFRCNDRHTQKITRGNITYEIIRPDKFSARLCSLRLQKASHHEHVNTSGYFGVDLPFETELEWIEKPDTDKQYKTILNEFSVVCA